MANDVCGVALSWWKMTTRFDYGFDLVINFIWPTWTLLILVEIKQQNMTKMLVFTLHLNFDAKLTTVNEITGNLFEKQAKSDK